MTRRKFNNALEIIDASTKRIVVPLFERTSLYDRVLKQARESIISDVDAKILRAAKTPEGEED